MLDDGTKSSPARQLSVSYVLDFIDGNFSFPARPASNMRPTTRGALQTASREVTKLRPRRRNLVPPPSSPPRANTPSGSSSRPPSSWRRLPFLSSR
ncbi:hypothetical protein CGCTS75_v013757 [Colletotrichum tropicale]|nr:hypothetical protein CGCTS75_v013757 [Colletotrichum tropicale]